MPIKRNPVRKRISPTLRYEKNLWRKDYKYVAGIDEAGRGALAGPVAAAAVILPQHINLKKQLAGVRDSKQLPAKTRIHWAELIKEIAVDWAVGFANSSEIDDIGILPATRLASQRALSQLNPQPDYLLIDYISIPEILIPQRSITKGDVRVLCIACASILAKVARDDHLLTLHDQFTAYGFASNKGYGTQAHREAIKQWGPSSIHRFSFAPIKQDE